MIPNYKGEFGGSFIDDTTKTDGNFLAFRVIADAVVSAIVMPDFENTDALVGADLPTGTEVLGGFSTITLTSGTVQVFKAIM